MECALCARARTRGSRSQPSAVKCWQITKTASGSGTSRVATSRYASGKGGNPALQWVRAWSWNSFVRGCQTCAGSIPART